jgi:hypothetical protein
MAAPLQTQAGPATEALLHHFYRLNPACRRLRKSVAGASSSSGTACGGSLALLGLSAARKARMK